MDKNKSNNLMDDDNNVRYDEKEYQTLRKHVSDICKVLKDYVKFQDVKPIDYTKGEKSVLGGYYKKFSVDVKYQTGDELIIKSKNKRPDKSFNDGVFNYPDDKDDE